MPLARRTGLMVLLLASLATTGALAAPARERMLVSPAWLAARLRDPSLVLFHIGSRAGYDSVHIPGARHLELSSVTVAGPSGAVYELPPVARLDSVLGAAGVGPG